MISVKDWDTSEVLTLKVIGVPLRERPYNGYQRAYGELVLGDETEFDKPCFRHCPGGSIQL